MLLWKTNLLATKCFLDYRSNTNISRVTIFCFTWNKDVHGNLNPVIICQHREICEKKYQIQYLWIDTDINISFHKSNWSLLSRKPSLGRKKMWPHCRQGRPLLCGRPCRQFPIRNTFFKRNWESQFCINQKSAKYILF